MEQTGQPGATVTVLNVFLCKCLHALLFRARLDKTNSFYTFHEHLGTNDVVEVFEKAPTDEKRYADYLREECLNREVRLFNKCAYRGDTKNSYLAYLNYFPGEKNY